MGNDVGVYWQSLQAAMAQVPLDLIDDAVDALLQCYERDGTVFVIGNGGSAATASHLACDLSKGTRVDGMAPFRCMPLTDNVPLMTAWANDASYTQIFAEQLSALLVAGDALVAISASGNSPNVLAATEMAHESGATVIGLTGQTGGRLSRLCDLTIRVPARSIEQVEDVHMAIAHTVCVAIRERLHALSSARLAAALAAPNVRPLEGELTARLKKRHMVAS